MTDNSYQVPAQNVIYNIFLQKFVGGIKTDSIHIVSPTYLPFPTVGDHFQIQDTIGPSKVSGIVRSVLHKNGVSIGPNYHSTVEIEVE